MRVMVTGGAGFIGSHVVDKLIEHGVTVRVFDLTAPAHRRDVEYYQGSILDMDHIRGALSGVDAVMHLAAVADVKDVFEDPHYAETVNVRGTANVLEAMRRAHVKRVVLGSTTWIYSDAQGEQVDESTPLTPPTHFYTATKLAAEFYCRSYAAMYGLEPTVLRYGIPYGPRARPGAVIPIFVDKALKGEPITIAGDGSQYRKFVYVEDLAEGNVLALAPAASNRTYNLDGDEKITIRQIADTVRDIVGDVRIEHTPARPGDFSGKDVSSRRAREELGWRPRTPFREGVRRYVEWVKAREQQAAERWTLVDQRLRA